MSAPFSCNSFAQIDWSNYQQNLQQALREEIHSQPKEYILGVDENEYKSYLIERYMREPLEISEDSEHITPRTETKQFQDPLYRTGLRDVYVFRVRYNFTGSPELFQVQPNPWTVTSHPISVDSAPYNHGKMKTS